MVGLLLFARRNRAAAVPPLLSRSWGILDKLGPEGAGTIGHEDRGVVGVEMGGQEQVLHLMDKRWFCENFDRLSLLKDQHFNQCHVRD